MDVADTRTLSAVVTWAWRTSLRLPAGAPELAMTWEAAGGGSIAML